MNKFVKGDARAFIPTISLLGGQLISFVPTLSITLAVVPDLLIILGAMLWLSFKPGLVPMLLLIAFQGIALVLNLRQAIIFASYQGGIEGVFLMHIILRITILWLSWLGWRKFRKKARNEENMSIPS